MLKNTLTVKNGELYGMPHTRTGYSPGGIDTWKRIEIKKVSVRCPWAALARGECTAPSRQCDATIWLYDNKIIKKDVLCKFFRYFHGNSLLLGSKSKTHEKDSAATDYDRLFCRLLR